MIWGCAMAESSKIAWTRSTFNPWIGCTRISAGCDHCYAEALDKRMRYGKAVHWGAGVPRFRTSAANWHKPRIWNAGAQFSEFAGRRGFWPVFCASLADVFDNEVPEQWRADLWDLIWDTPNLEWLLVTKRIGNVPNMLPTWRGEIGVPTHVRILITVCNQEEADRDIPKLLALPCKNGVSYEPALGPIDFSMFFEQYPDHNGVRVVQRHTGLDWIIVGGESTQGSGKARPFDIAWARSTIAQCKAARVPVFVKQIGGHAVVAGDSYIVGRGGQDCRVMDRAGADPAEWPEDLRVREFPA